MVTAALDARGAARYQPEASRRMLRMPMMTQSDQWVGFCSHSPLEMLAADGGGHEIEQIGDQ